MQASTFSDAQMAFILKQRVDGVPVANQRQVPSTQSRHSRQPKPNSFTQHFMQSRNLLRLPQDSRPVG
jgi:hypothetical protein